MIPGIHLCILSYVLGTTRMFCLKNGVSKIYFIYGTITYSYVLYRNSSKELKTFIKYYLALLSCVTMFRCFCNNNKGKHIINCKKGRERIQYSYFNTFATPLKYQTIWRVRVCHQGIMTSSNGNSFRVTGHLWGNSPVTGEFLEQRSVTRSFDVLFDVRLYKRLSKQS